MAEYKRRIGFYKNHFKNFYNEQSTTVKKKIDWTLLLIKTTRIVPEKFLKHLKDADGLWEIRISAGGGIIRIFCFFDKGNLMILLGGFKKKTKKTPKKEIEKATSLRREYYEDQ